MSTISSYIVDRNSKKSAGRANKKLVSSTVLYSSPCSRKQVPIRAPIHTIADEARGGWSFVRIGYAALQLGLHADGAQLAAVPV